jgi:putative glycosyltransferase (exosortase G-associated)
MMNVDSDTWLDSNAVLNVVKAFEKEPSLAAATGSIRVDKKLGEGSSFIDMINYCEVIEYIIAFDIGRRYQDIKNSIFTLSGAFSIFRRDIILQSFLYQTRTVSEDTDLTFNIRRAIEESQGRIGFIADAVAYVEPIENLSRLYSQRLRWQRGEVEVTGVHYERIPNIFGALLDFTGRILISDHTLAFSRLAWTFLLPFLYLLGYPLPTIIIALVGMFVCYLILESCTFYIAYKGSAPEYQKELQKIWWIVLFMPLYRYLVYWFRLAGIIAVLTEDKSWKTQNPVLELQSILQDYAADFTEEMAKRRQVN